MGLTGVFVSYRPFVEGRGGGVQICTREYIEILRLAGFDLKFQLFDADRRLSTRALRRLFASPYFRPAEPGLVASIRNAATQASADYIFLNQATLASLAPQFKSALPNCKIVVLSHGLESTDLLHALRLQRQLPITLNANPERRVILGDALLREAKYRSSVDVVCGISPFDADLERWLGTPKSFWLPRTIKAAALDWKPQRGRFGFVGTLDHAPNLEGLVKVLEIFDNTPAGEIHIRIVGGPSTLGAWLSKKFRCVHYLGPLDDEALKLEASTWNAFLHPIFCLARGCSTKLATALAWQIPIVTTEFGHRGYVWRAGKMAVGDDPIEFVRQCVDLLEPASAATAREDVAEIVRTSPTADENAALLLEHLGLH